MAAVYNTELTDRGLQTLLVRQCIMTSTLSTSVYNDKSSDRGLDLIILAVFKVKRLQTSTSQGYSQVTATRAVIVLLLY